MDIFKSLSANFFKRWRKIKLYFKESSNLANSKPVFVYPNVKIDLVPDEHVYDGLTKHERLEKIKQNLAYVWADGYESKKWEKRNVPYLGIRLTPSFVLHETIGYGHSWNLAEARCLARKCKARLLTGNEYQEVVHCWFKISEMRKLAGDFPLEEYLTWIYEDKNKQLNESCYILCAPNGKKLWLSEFSTKGNILLALK